MKSFILILLVSCIVASKIRYDNYKVYSVIPENEEHIKTLRELEQRPEYNFWSNIRGDDNPVHIMTSPYLDNDFQDAMDQNKIKREVFMENVQQAIDKSRPKIHHQSFNFNDYHTLEEIQKYMRHLKTCFPHNVKIIKVGKSYEGRDILGIRIRFHKQNSARGVFLEGGIHGAEWISTATVLYIATQILTSSDPEVRHIANSHDWYVFPNFNPDGYVYTFTHDRLWRKTREPTEASCYGSNMNRNWNYHRWGAGSSTDGCSENYAGSTVETASLSKFISSIGNKLIAYIAFHSFSQVLLIPYGDMHAENYDDLAFFSKKCIGDNAIERLTSRYGTEYKIGSIPEIYYPSTGLSVDWVKKNYHVPLTYIYQLRDKGRFGYLLPPERIIPTGEETLDSLMTILEEGNFTRF